MCRVNVGNEDVVAADVFAADVACNVSTPPAPICLSAGAGGQSGRLGSASSMRGKQYVSKSRNLPRSQTQHRFFKLFAPVFVVAEQIKAGAGGRKQHHIAGLPEFQPERHRLTDVLRFTDDGDFALEKRY